MNGSRTARLGFLGLALLALAEGGLSLWLRATTSLESYGQSPLAQVLSWLFIATGAFMAAAGLAIAKARAARAPALAFAAVSGLAFVVALTLRLMPWGSMKSDTVELVGRVSGYTQLGLWLLGASFLGLASFRIGRAAGVGAVSPAAAVLVILTAVTAVAQIGWIERMKLHSILYYVLTGYQALFGFMMARVVTRIGPSSSSEPALPVDDSAVDARWRTVAAGIHLYLVGVVARVFIMIVVFLTMRFKQPTSYEELRHLGDIVMMAAAFSGLAGLLVLGGIYRISKAPPRSGVSTPAMSAFVLGIVGMVLDVIVTKITVSATSGDLGAAFFAEDALPPLAAITMGVGVAAGASLLAALREGAGALGRTDLVAAARGAQTALIFGGSGAALLQVAAPHLGAAIVPLALITLPVLLYSAVRFITIALALATEIYKRAPAPDHSQS